MSNTIITGAPTVLLDQWQHEVYKWGEECQQKELFNARIANVMTLLIAVFIASMEFTRLFIDPQIAGEYSSIINFCVAVVVATQKSFNFDGQRFRYQGLAQQCYNLSDDILFQLNENIQPTRDLIEYTNSVKDSREKIRVILNQ